jgi:hypothetical protein
MGGYQDQVGGAGFVVPVFPAARAAIASGQAEAGPIIRRTGDPNINENEPNAIMAA